MASITFTQLIAPRTRLVTSKGQPGPFDIPNECLSVLSQPFPIAHLPYELRQLIYTQYFASLPSQNITCSNALFPHHTATALAVASPFLLRDSLPPLFYKHTVFSFSCPEALKTFSRTLFSGSDLKSRFGSSERDENKEFDKRRDVRRVKVWYGRSGQPTRDWVYLLVSNFDALEEVTFVVDREKDSFGVGQMCFGNWWQCVRDAMREGLISKQNQGKVLLRVEDGGWGVEKVVCYYDGRGKWTRVVVKLKEEI
jgi:hypothetical protein